MGKDIKIKAQGVIKGSNIVLKKPVKGLNEGDKVEVIIFPLKKTGSLFRTFKLGVKKEHLKRAKIYPKFSRNYEGKEK